MEFLNISLTKDSSILLHAVHSPFYYWGILKKTKPELLEGRCVHQHVWEIKAIWRIFDFTALVDFFHL
jgi:hypothetical protein